MFELSYYSGWGLKKEIIDILKSSAILNFSLSLNGSTEDINKLSREGYMITLQSMKKLMDAECPYSINWVARNDNVQDFPNLINLCKQCNARWISVTVNKLVGNSRKVDSELTKSDFLYLAEVIKNEKDIPVVIESCFPQLGSQIRPLKKPDGCAAGIYNCFINVEGAFSPCSYLNYFEHYDDISDYWHNSAILNDLRKKKKCSLCKSGCYFCRALSKTTYDNFLVEFEDCIMKS